MSFLSLMAAEQDSLRAIQSLIQAGQVQRADELATELVRSHPESYAAYEALGRVRDQEQRYQDAEAAYKHAMDLGATEASPHVSLGVSFARRGLSQAALEQFQEGLAKDPKNLTALLNAASLELQSGRFTEAEEYYRRGVQLAPSEPVALLGLATSAYAAGHENLANQTVQTLSAMNNPEINSSLAELFLNLGVASSAQHKYDAAKEKYFHAIDLNPGDPAPYVRIGSDYLAQGKNNFALAWLYRATRLDHGAPDTLYLLGQALLKEEYFQTAHDYLSKYVQAKPADHKGWLLLGDAYLNDERNEEALASYRKALTLVPQLATAHYLVGNAEYLLRREPEARQELMAALRLDPSHPEAQLRLGEIEYRDNQDDSAGARFRALLAAHPADTEAAYDLAKICMRHDQNPEARELLMKAVAQSPDDVRFHYLLSQVCRRLHQDELSSEEAATYARLKAEQDYQHRYIRHSHVYVE
jgi:tetratricopeptide (TPR) repeat protein